ncbi:MAG: hypothetical protein KKF46_07810 [Nanoarchaeota archaeon]|nr:hypothetical protein [Nanoarchaeota archaeon]MBU1322233.1 hypothetical protein [Nanoarchaeota archaeon]MBU1598042.1 hypothetical protein [Nanoarchaeota archaeon]MBU2442047.1 hypothetical protein [Nanoarchaeota archaeon]
MSYQTQTEIAKSDKTLEEEIKEIENKFPEITDRLKPYSGSQGLTHWESRIIMISYDENDKYQQVIAEWNECEYIKEDLIRTYKWFTEYTKEKDSSDSKLQERNTIMMNQIANMYE